ncbi:MAG: 16S rRNA (cytidine(1402)-2'-O)-methyltransferase [Gammaproteobacteria bacterium]|nr:16S rRNA (cytidine(1402)-2'-O)-methyltransferase [Gammaproteobacteria bacterium]
MSAPVTLYVIATPIGNLADISARALEVLRDADLIAAEDTRHSKALLNHYTITTPMISLHEHNESERIAELTERLQQGQSIALISDAGTPLLSDPGFMLVRAAHEHSIPVSPVPGPSAITAALSAAGLPTNAFYFAGFLAAKQKARCEQLQELSALGCTVVLFESTHRILNLLSDIVEQLGAEQKLVIARELTKKFETILSGNAAELLQQLENDENQQKGEFVVLLAFDKKLSSSDQELNRCLKILLEELPVKQAAKLAAKLTGAGKNQAYEMAVKLKDK